MPGLRAPAPVEERSYTLGEALDAGIINGWSGVMIFRNSPLRKMELEGELLGRLLLNAHGEGVAIENAYVEFAGSPAKRVLETFQRRSAKFRTLQATSGSMMRILRGYIQGRSSLHG